MTSEKRSRTWLVLAGFLIVAGFFLLTEHHAHRFGFLSFLLLLAGVVLVFTHREHGGHGGGDGADPHAGHRAPEEPRL